MTALIAAWTY